MTFFEKELRRIVKHSEMIHHPKFVGRECIARLSEDITVKLSFRSLGIANQYDTLHIRIMNRHEGEIDNQIIRFADLWGKVTMRSSGSLICPHIWDDCGRVHWYGFTPNEMQYDLLSHSVDEYLECFAEPEQTAEMDISMQ